MSTLEDITKTTVKLLIREPFYGHFFTNIQKKLNTSISRATISLTHTGGIELEVNPSYWESLEIHSKIGCIKHQILHLILGHIYKTKKFGDKKLFHLATDLVVNQYIAKEQLDPQAITLNDFLFSHLKPHESLEYYYKKLQEEISPQKLFGNSDININKKTGTKNFDNNTVTNTNNNNNNNNNNDDDDGTLCSTEKQLLLEEHSGWKTFEEQSDPEKKNTIEKLDTYTQMSAYRISTKDFGNLPDTIKNYIKESQERLQPSLNWKRALRLFMQNSRKTYLKTTLKKPSRRYGTIPGIKIKHKQKILIAIDTSLSVSPELLNEFFSEIYHIWKQASEIKIIECDTMIQSVYVYRGITPKFINGRGGTNFNPPIIYANTYRPDVLIYFTDGKADTPTIPCRAPIIWVIPPDDISFKDYKYLPGRKVMLKANTRIF